MHTGIRTLLETPKTLLKASSATLKMPNILIVASRTLLEAPLRTLVVAPNLP